MTLTIKAAGGGGFGSPYLRPAQEVPNDVLNEMVGREMAEADYGVVMTGKDLQIDEEATRIRRQKFEKLESRP
ncbi:N-methylhydantoinase B/oxoprolinase/acetone carboxylase alpha subunit [Bradyrhizobium sp. USDA 4341]